MVSNFDEERIKNELFQRFISPTINNDKEYIGVEIEIPIINLNKEAVDFNIVHKVTDIFKNHFDSFEVVGKDYDGNIFSLKNRVNNDVLCFDCSYNNIEFAMGKEEELFSINKRFTEYYSFIKSEFERYNYTLTGMGINPYRKYNLSEPIPNERYMMLYHHLKSYPQYGDIPMYFHKFPDYGLFSSSSQVQLDVNYDDLIDTINTSTKLEPIKAILFSNSVFLGENEEYVCYRDLFWEHSTHGINKHNIGMYNIELKDINQLISYLYSFNIYSVMRNNKYINFKSIPLEKYFSSSKIEGQYRDNGKYKSIEFAPKISDVSYVRPFKFVDLTFRGTIEYRSICTQPIKYSMMVSAFHLGLKHKNHEINELLNEYKLYDYPYSPDELRKIFIKRNLPSFINEDRLYELCEEITELSKEGLTERGYGEEVFLNPLFENIKNRVNPGKRLLDGLDEGIDIEEFIRYYGSLNNKE